MKYSDGEGIVLAILDELCQVHEGLHAHLGDPFQHVDHGIDDASLELETTLVSQSGLQEPHEVRDFTGEPEAELMQGLYDDALKFIREIILKEGLSLLEQTFNPCLPACLEQSGDRKRCDGAVAVIHSSFQLYVAAGDFAWMSLSYPGELSHCREPLHRHGVLEHVTEHGDGRTNVLRSDAGQAANSLGCLESHHVRLVAGARVQECVSLPRVEDAHVPNHEVTRVSNQHAE